MKKNRSLRVACACLLCCAPASAAFTPQSGMFGAGVELGEQNGGTAKYWLDRNQAAATGLGVSDGLFSFHAEYLWHAWDIFPQPAKGTLAAHASLGMRVRSDQVGIRPTIGADYWIEGHPVEVFIDGGPIFRLSPDSGVDFAASIGARFYFANWGK